MTKLLFLEDSYQKEFDAKIIAIEGDRVELDQTCFYPQGGGQPYDTGKINDRNVLEVKKENGKILHKLDNISGLAVGQNVHGIIDWNRRYKFMRSHTAEHIFSKVVINKTKTLVTGNNMDLEKIRMDYNIENYTPELISECVNEANRIIQSGLEISTKTIPREEAENDPSLFQLMKAFPPQIRDVRIVSIGSFDSQADGGTHVKITVEVGRIEFIKAESKGTNNKRIYLRLIP